MIFDNATITTRRQGTVILSNHRVQWEVPSLKERTMAVGAIFDARIFDEASQDWHEGDVVALTELDDNILPQVTKYRVSLVISEPGPLEVTECALIGVEQ